MYAASPQLQVEEEKTKIDIRMHKKIIVPYDGSDNSFRAFQTAVDIASMFGSHVVVVHACEKERCYPNIFDRIKSYISEDRPEAEQFLDYKILRFDPDKSSVSSELIKEIVLGGYDLVVMSARGTSVNDELYIGSVAASIIMNTNTSIYMVR